MLPFLIVAEIIYGPLNYILEQRLKELSTERERLFCHVLRGGCSRFFWLRYLPTKANRDLASFRRKWHQLNQDFQYAAARCNSGTPIIQMFRSVENSQITREQLFQTFDEMLFANLDITVSGIGWNLVVLAANSQIQEKLRTEIRSRKKICGIDT